MINSKRIGKIRISLQHINDNPEAAHLAMSVFIPLKAEIFPEGWVEYIGVCDQFDERGEGCVTPLYDFNIIRNEDGSLSIKQIYKV